LKEEGVFPDVDDDILEKIESPEDFRNLIENQIQAGLQEKQKQIDEALKAGVEPSQIQQYEQVISVLSSINDDAITDEGDKGEQLRKDLIYQDFINRGYSEERAKREVKKSFDSGSDIEDAKEALKSNLEFYKKDYNSIIEKNKQEEAKKQEILKQRASSLKRSILEDKTFLGDLEVDKNTRQKVFDTISKPIYKDPDTGEYLTALQKYEQENKLEFLKNVGIIYTLTDGFKNIDKLVKNKVGKEVKKGLKDLERTLNNTRRDSNGNLQYMSNIGDDPESFIGKGWNLDV
jgi:predicted RNase H-like HicB family nuclease